MPSLLHFQIIVDVAFFVVILLLLRQIHRRVERNSTGGDGPTLEELKKLMTDSQASTDLFLRLIQESEEKLNKLARHLDNKEKRIVILLEKADSIIQEMASQQAKEESIGSDGEKYKQIISMVQQGLGREEVAKRLGATIGEIDLVLALEHAKAAHP